MVVVAKKDFAYFGLSVVKCYLDFDPFTNCLTIYIFHLDTM